MKNKVSPSVSEQKECEMHDRSIHGYIPDDARCNHCSPQSLQDTLPIVKNKKMIDVDKLVELAKEKEGWEKEVDEFFKHSMVNGEVHTGLGNIKALFEGLFSKQIQLAVLEERERLNDYMAYCECGDALERENLYPDDAIYYCFGCDKTYRLSILLKK